MRVSAAGIEFNYERSGSGSTLVLLHGLGGDATGWELDAEVFERHHDVVRWDARGHGKSTKAPGPYSPELFASDLAAFLTAIGVERAHVLGISMGGVVAQRFALDFPRMVDGLLLLSTSSEVGPQATEFWEKSARAVEERGFSESQVSNRGFALKYMAEHQEDVAAMAARQALNDPKSWAASARAVSAYNWTADLARVAAPTLILQGLDDVLTPPGGSVIMSRRIPNSRLLMLKECGHGIPLEQPEVYRQSVLAFLAGVDLSRSTG
jgi:3-oxoadipate enol-lactonase